MTLFPYTTLFRSAEEDATRFRRSRSRSPQRTKAGRPKEVVIPRNERPLVIRGERQLSKQEVQPRQEGQKGKLKARMEYRPHFTSYAKFDRPRYEIFEILTEKYSRPAPLDMDIFEVTNGDSYCEFHRRYGHDTEECGQLKDVLEKMARAGELIRYLRKEFYERNVRRYNGKGKVYRKTLPLRQDWIDRQKQTRGPTDNGDRKRTPERQRTPVIHVISGGLASGGDTQRERRMYTEGRANRTILSIEAARGSKRSREREVISFSEKDMEGVNQPHDDAVVLSLKINAHRVERVLVDIGSSADILYLTALKAMQYGLADLQPIRTPLVGFTGDTLQAEGRIRMSVTFGTLPQRVTTMVDFLVVDVPSAYNAIIGRTTLNVIRAIVSTPHLKIKFHTDSGVGEEKGHQRMARECYQRSEDVV